MRYIFTNESTAEKFLTGSSSSAATRPCEASATESRLPIHINSSLADIIADSLLISLFQIKQYTTDIDVE